MLPNVRARCTPLLIARGGFATIERRGGDPREDMRHVGGGWSTPQREILRWGWGGLDPPARDLALGGAGR